MKPDLIINVLQLKPGNHQFDFSIHSDFFEQFSNPIISTGDFSIDIHLQKSETTLIFDFHITGLTPLQCDRSSEIFEYSLNTKKRLIFQYSKIKGDPDGFGDVELIETGTPSIDVSQYIYELICLAIPQKKISPNYYKPEDDLKEANDYSVYSTFKKIKSSSGDSLDIDPRWEKLKGLKGD